MGPARLHPRFSYLMATGRTSCCGFNVQNLPNEKGLLADDPAASGMVQFRAFSGNTPGFGLPQRGPSRRLAPGRTNRW